MTVRAGRAIAGRFAFAVAALVIAGGCASTLSREQLAAEYYNIGSAYFELGELDKSAEYLGRAIELSPELARASYNLARVYVIQSRYQEALSLLDVLLEEDPVNTLVVETIAYTHFESGDLAAAAAWYDRALAVSPTDPDLLQNRAVVAMERGDFDLAVGALRRALDFGGERPGVHLNLARAELELGNTVAARDAYEAYFAGAPSPEPAVLVEYADLLVSEEFYADAIEVLERVTSLSSASASIRARAHFHMGGLLLTEAEEEQGGLDAIRAAVSLGFSDNDAAVALLERPTLVGRAELHAIFAETEWFDDEAVPAEPLDGSAAE